MQGGAQETESAPAGGRRPLPLRVRLTGWMVTLFSLITLVMLGFPLWLGSMPALLKAYLEQLMRPGFAFAYGKGRQLPKKLLKGKSARIVVTMGMPSLFYRLYYRSHSVRSLVRNILGFVGFKPVRVSLIGNVENSKARARGMAELIAHARAGS
jgi:putative NADPH-quinone reductase